MAVIKVLTHSGGFIKLRISVMMCFDKQSFNPSESKSRCLSSRCKRSIAEDTSASRSWSQPSSDTSDR